MHLVVFIAFATFCQKVGTAVNMLTMLFAIFTKMILTSKNCMMHGSWNFLSSLFYFCKTATLSRPTRLICKLQKGGAFSLYSFCYVWTAKVLKSNKKKLCFCGLWTDVFDLHNHWSNQSGSFECVISCTNIAWAYSQQAMIYGVCLSVVDSWSYQ